MRLFASILLVLLSTTTAVGQLEFDVETHDYEVFDLDNYQESITIQGRNTSFHEQQVGFPVNELAELTSYQLYEKKGSKWKPSKLKKEVTISSIDRSAFFSGMKYYYFQIPAGMEFKLEFSTREKHTIFLTKCYKTGWFDAAVVRYNFSLPENLQFTARNGETRTSSFVIAPEFYDDEPSVPYLIHPATTEPIAYFSGWFEERINPQFDLDPNLVPLELTDLADTGTRLELAKACFQFVQKEIKYIDIENGINAIIPRQCEKVLKNRLGDCKDMATLLTALYRHFGFDAYSAISRTNGKADVLNFPSLSLADHTICALRFSEKWYFLDATEDACIFGDASIQTLGSEVFLVGVEGDPFLNVDENPRSDSWASLYYRLEEDMTLKLKMRISGKMNLLMYHVYLKEKDQENVIESVLERFSGMQMEVDDFTISDTMSVVNASVPLSSSSYSKVGSKKLYNLGFLPDLTLMTALFQNSRYPLFDADISFTLDFGGTIQNAPDSQPDENLLILQSNNTYRIKCQLKKEVDRDSFEESSLVSAWNNFIKQPLLFQYEK